MAGFWARVRCASPTWHFFDEPGGLSACGRMLVRATEYAAKAIDGARAPFKCDRCLDALKECERRRERENHKK